jgi:hypothetical protein
LFIQKNKHLIITKKTLKIKREDDPQIQKYSIKPLCLALCGMAHEEETDKRNISK